jgi:hypothetical protein
MYFSQKERRTYANAGRMSILDLLDFEEEMF